VVAVLTPKVGFRPRTHTRQGLAASFLEISQAFGGAGFVCGENTKEQLRD